MQENKLEKRIIWLFIIFMPFMFASQIYVIFSEFHHKIKFPNILDFTSSFAGIAFCFLYANKYLKQAPYLQKILWCEGFWFLIDLVKNSLIRFDLYKNIFIYIFNSVELVPLIFIIFILVGYFKKANKKKTSGVSP